MFNGPTHYQDATLINNGFWPDVNLAYFQKRRSLPVDIDAATLEVALVAIVAEINLELAGLESRYPLTCLPAGAGGAWRQY